MYLLMESYGILATSRPVRINDPFVERTYMLAHPRNEFLKKSLSSSADSSWLVKRYEQVFFAHTRVVYPCREAILHII